MGPVCAGRARALVRAHRRRRATMRARALGLSGGTAVAMACDVLVAAGGTGGHVFPALAVAEALRDDYGAAVEFAGGPRVERFAVPSAGFALHAVRPQSTGAARPLLQLRNVLTAIRLLVAVAASVVLIARLRPKAVLGTGGYTALPTCIAAAITGTPLIIQEQNATPGLATRLVAPFATVVCVAFQGAADRLANEQCVLIGNPTRAALARHRLPPPAVARATLLSSSPPANGRVVAVLGGSLGARAINDAVEGALKSCFLQRDRWLVWQAGGANHAELADRLGPEARQHPRLALAPFFDDMATLYAAADLVVCRSGAITCSELLATGTPAVLVPSPNVTDDHQTGNAEALVAVGAAVLLPEAELDRLPTIVDGLLSDPDRLAEMRAAALAAATPDATGEIAERVAKLAGVATERYDAGGIPA